jgi:hypothetical protein
MRPTTRTGPPVSQIDPQVRTNRSACRPYSRQKDRGGGAGAQSQAGSNVGCGSCDSYWLRFWRSLPGLKRMVRPGGMRTSLPVRGLRPMPRLRGFTWKTPKPRSSIRSPCIIESFMASRTASTATSALTLVMSAAFETSLMMSTLIMGDGTPSLAHVLSSVRERAVKP